jgi:hypothetical protein
MQYSSDPLIRPESGEALVARIMTSDRLADEPAAAAVAKQVIDSSQYLTLATADGAGQPWACPVWYAHEGYTSFLWISRPSARHSLNLGLRPAVSAVIFDSAARPGQAQAVYLEAMGEELSGAERDRSVAVFSRRSLEFGLSEWRPADMAQPAPHRLYRASASAVFIYAPGDRRLPVKLSELK